MIERIKKQVEAENYRFTIHGLERCVERHISPDEVKCYVIRRGHRRLSKG
jgi:hypothetical protein